MLPLTIAALASHAVQQGLAPTSKTLVVYPAVGLLALLNELFGEKR